MGEQFPIRGCAGLSYDRFGPINNRETTDSDRAAMTYKILGLDELVRKFAICENRPEVEAEIQQKLTALSTDISRLAFHGTNIQVDVVRRAFDSFYASLNKHGGEATGIQKHTGVMGALLQKAGVKKPQYKDVMRPLDDSYWDEEFMQGFREQRFVEPLPDESEQEHFARYVNFCLTHLSWNYFTYAV